MSFEPLAPRPNATVNRGRSPSFSRALFAGLLPLVAGLAGTLLAAVALAKGAGRMPWPALLAAGILLLVVAFLAAGQLVRRWSEGQLELSRRVAELSTLEEVGRAMAQAQFDVAAVCRLLHEHTSRVVDATIFHLGLFERDSYAIKLWVRDGIQEPGRSFPLSPGVGLVNWMRDSRKPLRVRDFETEMESLPARPVYVAERPPRSALFVPLMAGEQVIGTLSVQSYRPDAYSSSDERVLSAMANQAALAIQKAQAYELERKRVRQLQTIGQVSRQVAATLRLEELFRQTVSLVRESFGYYYVGVFTADRQAERVDFQASSSAVEGEVQVAVDWGQGMIGWVAANGRPAIANDVEEDERYRPWRALKETRSEVAVPLCLEDELVGVLDAQSNEAGAFSEDDLFILGTLGAQVAIAIQEARLYEAEKEQVWLSTALLQVSDALSLLSDMEEILTTVVRLTAMLVGVERCGILRWDDEEEEFLPSKAYGLTEQQRERFAAMRFPASSFAALDQLRQEKAPILVNASEPDSLLPAELVEAFEARQMVALPLVAQGELLGAMIADYATRPHRVDERVMGMLNGLAHQAALAILSARLLQAQEDEAYTSMALLQVADVVSHSGSLHESLASVLRITPMLVGVDGCALFLPDEEGIFVPHLQYGLPDEAEPAFWAIRLPPGELPEWTQAANKRYSTAGQVPALAALEAALGTSTPLLVPVTVRGEVAALMEMACSGAFRHVTDRRIAILAGIADQVGVAIETDRFMQEAAEQERMKQELEVAKRIQMSFLPEHCPDIPGWEIAAVWRSAREVAGDFYDFIPQPLEPGREPGRIGIAVADVADKGVPAALYMALSRTLLRTMAIAGRPPAATVATANDLILADARAELFVTLFYLVLDPASGEIAYVNAGHPPPILVRAKSGVSVELRTGGMAMGVLPNLEYEERTVCMEPGDALVLYTDGIIEAPGEGRALFGRVRLADAARAARHQPAAQMGESIEAAVAQFTAGAPQTDDLTLVIVRRLPQ
ncbi:MAG TPA: GAF domain-containing protein [Anaerolineae bacterium]|nr:GAF domain-containing protein [Anaerolineae bacterium]